MELVGTIKKISPLQQITPTFSKREVVILTDEMYPQTIMVEFAQSRAALVDAFTEGQYVKVSINLRGREWTDPKTGDVRYFTSVGGWRIEASAPAWLRDSHPPLLPIRSHRRVCRHNLRLLQRRQPRPAMMTIYRSENLEKKITILKPPRRATLRRFFRFLTICKVTIWKRKKELCI